MKHVERSGVDVVRNCVQIVCTILTRNRAIHGDVVAVQLLPAEGADTGMYVWLLATTGY